MKILDAVHPSKHSTKDLWFLLERLEALASSDKATALELHHMRRVRAELERRSQQYAEAKRVADDLIP